MDSLRIILSSLVLIFLCVVFSTNWRKISWRVVIGGIGLQVAFAFLILKTPIAGPFFKGLDAIFNRLFEFVGEGSRFLFGPLVDEAPFAFQVLAMVLFFSAIMRVLYELGVMHRIVYWVGLLMKRTLGTSGAESLAAAANVMFGQTEAPLLVRPYVERMTRSELMALMTGGMATVAGSVMAAYVGMLSGSFPDIAGHLVAASVMSAPAAFVFAKLLVPETEVAETRGGAKLEHEKTCSGVLHSLAEGTRDGIPLVVNIAAMLLVFLSLVHIGNFAWGFGCNLASGWFGWDLSSVDTLQELAGWAFAPVAWGMGVPWSEAPLAGALLGEKMVLNEFVAYADFGRILSGEPLAAGIPWVEFSPKTQIVLTYALCGFANFSSIGILIGGLGIFAPKRRGEIAALGIRSMIAATLACFQTAAIAALLL